MTIDIMNSISAHQPYWSEWSPNRKGDYAESQFILACQRHGIVPCSPPGDHPYDFVTDYNGFFKRVQVKWAGRRGKSLSLYAANTRSSQGHNNVKMYDADDIDVMAVYIPDHNVFYLFGVEELKSEHLSIAYNKPKYQHNKDNWRLLKAYDQL